MNDNRSNPEKPSSLLEELTQLSKSALYRVAQMLGIPKRSLMNKSELVEALSQKEDEAETVMMRMQNNHSEKKPTLLRSIPSAVSAPDKPVAQETPVTPLPIGQIKPVRERPVESVTVTSAMPEPAPKPAPKEPESVWVGEEGPELPAGYGITVLRALPRDPHWAYLYWEISQETRNHIRNERGEWFFDVCEPMVRVFNHREEIINEVPVLLDTNCWYLKLSPNGAFQFELGLKDSEGIFHTLARSNRLVLPPMEPSEILDENWAMISDEFQEVLYNAAGLETTTPLGGSPSMAPHVLRHRTRVPWVWSNQQLPSSAQWPSSQIWPSSHALSSSSQAMPSPIMSSPVIPAQIMSSHTLVQAASPQKPSPAVSSTPPIAEVTSLSPPIAQKSAPSSVQKSYPATKKSKKSKRKR